MVANDPQNSIFSTLIQTLKTWIGGDRVRVAGSHGRSLSLQPDDLIFVKGSNFLVQTRTLTDDADSQYSRLVYQLIDQETNQTRTLEVLVRKDGTDSTKTLLKGGQNVSSICDADITIL